MEPELQSALIAAAVTVGGFFVRDVGLKTIERRRERAQTADQVYRSYADPLTRSAESLYWRLDEIYGGRRSSDYLFSATTEYERYKLLSTSYRIASFLGWRQAFSRELLLLPGQKKEQLRRLNEALDGISKALADGPHIELQRVETVMELWSLTIGPGVGAERLGARLDTVFNRTLNGWGVDLPLQLDDMQKSRLARELAAEVSRHDPTISIEPAVVDATASDLARRTSVRECWIYRDWQAGIGDFMIEAAPEASTRLYEVIGFAEFESRTVRPDDDSERWLTRLESLLTQLDVDVDPATDARIEQLRGVYEALASLLVVLADRSDAQRDYLKLTGTLSSATSSVNRVNDRAVGR
jgi:hypothetical protein